MPGPLKPQLRAQGMLDKNETFSEQITFSAGRKIFNNHVMVVLCRAKSCICGSFQFRAFHDSVICSQLVRVYPSQSGVRASPLTWWILSPSKASMAVKAKSVPAWLVLCFQPSQQQRQHSLLRASRLPAHVLRACSPSPHMQVASAMPISISSDFPSWWEHMHLGQKPNSLLDFAEQPGPKQLMLHYQQGPYLSTGSLVSSPLAI